MTELEFRNKVTWFSFALSLLVIWVHSYNAELFLGYQAATGTVYVPVSYTHLTLPTKLEV